MKKIEYDGNKTLLAAGWKRFGGRGTVPGQLAAKMQTMNVNIDQQMISRIERNLRIVTDYELVCFCRVLGVEEKKPAEGFLSETGWQRIKF